MLTYAGGELDAVICVPNVFSNNENPCFEVDQPLDTRFTMRLLVYEALSHECKRP